MNNINGMPHHNPNRCANDTQERTRQGGGSSPSRRSQPAATTPGRTKPIGPLSITASARPMYAGKNHLRDFCKNPREKQTKAKEIVKVRGRSVLPMRSHPVKWTAS